MYTLENKILKLTIDAKGAELKSIVYKINNLEYMWSGDPAFWAKTSPVLFPIIGTLKNDKYEYEGEHYSLSRHGFARDKTFLAKQEDDATISFTLKDDADSLNVYPFHFSFAIIYRLEKNILSVTYQVENTGDDTMPFSVGGHPAFKLPLVKGTSYEDYTLHFEMEENAGRWPISAKGLIENKPQPLLEATNNLPLNKQLFQKDAIVLKHLQSDWVSLTSAKTPHGLKFHFTGFNYLGLWAVPGADFICIEPWCGIADSVHADGNIMNKEGIIPLPADESFSVTWQVEIF